MIYFIFITNSKMEQYHTYGTSTLASQYKHVDIIILIQATM